jgi:hypothetical protein
LRPARGCRLKKKRRADEQAGEGPNENRLAANTSDTVH